MKSFLLILTVLALFFSSHAQTSYEILVHSRANNEILKYDETGYFLESFINSAGLIHPEDVYFHPDGSILVTGHGNSEIKQYDGIIGAFIGN